MTHDLEQIIQSIINNIIDNIRQANELITTLKKYIDITDYTAFLARLTKDFIEVYNLTLDEQVPRVPELIYINLHLNIICAEMQYNIHVQKINYNRFDGMLMYPPETVDMIIKNMPQPALQNYVCHQSKLIGGILTFCNTEKLDGVKIFYFFNDSDIHQKWQELHDIKKGLCFGLSSLFLLCGFISDMQQYKTVTGPEDDLRWFYRCIFLLQLRCYKYSPSQKQDITRFISLVMHLQNNKIAQGMSNYLFPKIHVPPLLQQGNNLWNVEFSGANFIAYEYTHSKNPEFIDTLTGSKDALYLQFGLYDQPNPGHSVSLHKNFTGLFTFYDPSLGVTDVSLKNKEEFLLFKGKYLVNRQDTISVTIGRRHSKVSAVVTQSKQPPKKRLCLSS